MNEYNRVLFEIYKKARYLQSDFARYNAHLIAEMASRKHIVSVLAGVATNKWYITSSGTAFLKQNGWL